MSSNAKRFARNTSTAAIFCLCSKPIETAHGSASCATLTRVIGPTCTGATSFPSVRTMAEWSDVALTAYRRRLHVHRGPRVGLATGSPCRRGLRGRGFGRAGVGSLANPPSSTVIDCTYANYVGRVDPGLVHTRDPPPDTCIDVRTPFRAVAASFVAAATGTSLQYSFRRSRTTVWTRGIARAALAFGAQGGRRIAAGGMTSARDLCTRSGYASGSRCVTWRNVT
jgi:hypothetical protein